MDLLKIAGIITILLFLSSFFFKVDVQHIFSSISGMFTNILNFFQRSQNDLLFIEINASNFILTSSNINLIFNGKIESLSISSLSLKIKKESNYLEISNFEGSIEASSNISKMTGKANYIKINELEFTSPTSIVANLIGRFEKLTIESVDKVNIKVREGELVFKKGESVTKLNVINKEIILTDVKSLEYKDGKFSIIATNINRESLI